MDRIVMSWRSLNVGPVLMVLGILVAATASIVGQSQSVFYVRPGATGANTGADWTNAYAEIPASPQRGATYYLADGKYEDYTLNAVAVSGTHRINLKKATVEDHGTNTGWSNSYGDGVAEFTRMVILSSYVTVDGQIGQWASDLPNYVPYRITVKSAPTFDGANIIRLGTSSAKVSFVELKHMEVAQTNTPFTGTWGNSQFLIRLYAHDSLLRYVWAHDSGSKTLSPSGSRHTFEYSVFERPCHAQVAMKFSPSEHCEIQKGDPDTHGHILRYSYLRDWRSTGGWIAHSNNNDFEIYGNIFETTGYWGAGNDGNGAINGRSTQNYDGWKIYNNTFLMAYGCRVISGGFGNFTNSVVRNNLFYNCQLDSGSAQVGGTKSHNWYFGSGSQSETGIQHGTGDPFIDRAAKDFRLRAGTLLGVALDQVFRTDMRGRTRGEDGVWDRGAFEYSGSSTAPAAPAAPQNVRIVP